MDISEIRNAMANEQRGQQDQADAEARRWWNEREAKAEKDMSLALHKRMETQRAQIHAFKLEQSKWEHELQLRISKYSHDRKLLSEHNIELQEELVKIEERNATLQRENDLQAAQILELQGQLRGTESGSQQIHALQAENVELSQRVVQWESNHRAAVAAAVQRQETLQNDLISALEQKLEDVLKDNDRLRDGLTGPADRSHRRGRAESQSMVEGGGGGGGGGGERQPVRRSNDQEAAVDGISETAQCRIAELEKACKHKDQIILSLKSMLERHESISDDKIKLIQSKYDQVKAINIALQRKLLQSFTDASPQAHDERIATREDRRSPR